MEKIESVVKIIQHLKFKDSMLNVGS